MVIQVAEALSSHKVGCPYCGEPIELLLDFTVPRQDYIEDCAVCCRPIEVGLTIGDRGRVDIAVRREDEA